MHHAPITAAAYVRVPMPRFTLANRDDAIALRELIASLQSSQREIERLSVECGSAADRGTLSWMHAHLSDAISDGVELADEWAA